MSRVFNEFKYVVGEIRTTYGLIYGAVVIPVSVEHSSVKAVFENIYSAGFGYFDQNDVYVDGHAISLGVAANQVHDPRLVGQAIAHPKYR